MKKQLMFKSLEALKKLNIEKIYRYKTIRELNTSNNYIYFYRKCNTNINFIVS